MVKRNLLFNCYFFLLTTACFGQVTNSSNPCYRLDGAALAGTFFSKSIPLEEDKYDRNKDGKTQYFQINCGKRKWNHHFYPVKIRKGIDEDVPVVNESPYRTILFDDFNHLDTNLWKPRLDNTYPLNVLNSLRSTSNHKPENVKVKDGMLHMEVHRMDESDVYDFSYKGNDYHVERTHSTSSIQTIHPTLPDEWKPGCFRHGRFSTRVKLPSLEGDSKGTNAAFWFWPGEFDVFEMYQPDIDELQTNFHQWKYGDEHPTFSLDFRIDFEAFHVFTFEWTPYKFVYSMDGETMFVLYRFYEILDAKTCEEDELCSIYSEPTIRGLDGDEIPDATNEDDYFEVWEHGSWQNLASGTYYTDLILGAGQAHGRNPLFGEMLVDWVEIEQQVNGLNLPDNYYMCGSGREFFFLETPFPEWQDIEWAVSDNLTIISESNHGIEVQPLSEGTGTAWIDLTYWNWKTNRLFDTKVRQEIELVSNENLESPNELLLSFQVTDCYYQIKIPNSIELADEYQWEIRKADGSIASFTTVKPFTPFFTQYELSQDFTVEVFATNVCQSSASFKQSFSAPNLLGECEKKLIVYPNPVKNVLHLKIEEIGGTNLQLMVGTVEIYNQFGVKIMTQKIDENINSLDISKLATGVYHIFYKTAATELLESEVLQAVFVKIKNF